MDSQFSHRNYGPSRINIAAFLEEIDGGLVGIQKQISSPENSNGDSVT